MRGGLGKKQGMEGILEMGEKRTVEVNRNKMRETRSPVITRGDRDGMSRERDIDIIPDMKGVPKDRGNTHMWTEMINKEG